MALALLLFRSAWASPQAKWVGSCCDPEQSMWFLRWTPYAVTHLQSPWFTDHLNFPDGVNLMWNATMQFPAFVLTPVTLLFGSLVAYNVLMTLNLALASWTAYLAIRRYASHQASAVVGGLLYGFSPYMLPQTLAHAQLTVAFIPPLMLIVLDEILIRQRHPPWKLGIALGVLAAAQLLSSEEILVTEVVVAAVLLGVLAAVRPRLVRARLRPALSALLTAGYTFLILAAWPLYTQFFGLQRVVGNIQEPDVFVNDLLGFVIPTDTQWFNPDAATKAIQNFTGLSHEFNAYVGFPLLLLLGVAVGRLWGNLVVRVAAIVGVIVAICSLGPHLHINGGVTSIPLPWGLIAHLPLMNDVLPSRLGLYMFLCVGVVLAAFIDWLLESHIWRRRVPGLAIVALALVPLLPQQPFPATTATIPAFFQHWDQSGVPTGSVVLVAPFIRDGGQADPMLWQAVANDGFRMPQGYYFIPDEHGKPMYGARSTNLSNAMERIQEKGTRVKFAGEALTAADRELRERRVETVIVGPMDNHDSMVAFFTTLFARSPEEVGGVEIWRHVDTQGVDLSAG